MLPLASVDAGALPADAASVAQSTGGLEEIIVTARRREEPLQKVPVSVAALTYDQMEERSLVTLQDVSQATPNVSFYNQANEGSVAGLVFIRGIGQTDPLITNDPGVGVYLDGVYFGRMQGVNLDTMDVSRIEILRGPQGTLFGKNTIGGAINVVTNEASLQDTTGFAQATTGSFGRADAVARISLPLVPEQLGLSVSLGTRNERGYGRRLIDGQNMGNVKQVDGRLQLRYKPSDALEFLLAADATHVGAEQGDQQLLAVNPASPLVGGLNSFSNPPYDSRWLTGNPFTSYSTGNNFSHGDIWGTSLTAIWDTGAATFKSITAYRRNRTNSGVDPDGSPLTLINQVDRVDQDQFSEELQLSGLSFGNRLNWVAGLYFFREHASEAVLDDLFTAFRGLPPPFALDLSFNTNVGANNKAYAAYGQGSYSLTEQLHLTLGVRETYEDKTGNVYRYAPYSGDFTIIPFTGKSADWSSFTPRVSLDYQFTPDVMGYVSAAAGFKSGGFNGRANNAAGLVQYNPEKAWTYEVGARSEWLDKSVRLNATGYYTDYKDIQYTIIGASVGGQPNIVVGNAAAARIDGAELELNVIPLRNLTLTAAGGLTDAKYTSVTTTAQLSTSDPFQDSPKWTGTLAGQYVFPLLRGAELVTHADMNYRSVVYFAIPVTPYVRQGGYSLINARLTLRSSAERGWSVAAFGTNLSNKHYMTSASDVTPVLGFATGFFQAPREWGATVEFRF